MHTRALPLFLPLLLLLTPGACAPSSPSADASSDAARDGTATSDGGTTDASLATQDVAPGNSAAVSAAQAFLSSLSSTQRAAASFAYDDAAQRTHWSNFPTGIFQRDGVRLGDLTTAQQDALFALLGALLSAEGLTQVRNCIAADEALRASSGGGMLTFGQAEYYVSFMGTPSTTSPWRLQFGGHHMALNITVVGSNITLAPSLTGAQPTSFTLNGVTVRPQGVELDLAFALVNALDSTQRARALLGSTYMDLALGPGQDGRTLAPEGIPASALTAAQQAQLVALLRARVGMVNDAAAALRMAELESHLAETYFAWSGPTAVGSAAYWRVTGPTLVLEYAPQAMGGDATAHTHAMYRDPTNDYGVGFVP